MRGILKLFRICDDRRSPAQCTLRMLLRYALKNETNQCGLDSRICAIGAGSSLHASSWELNNFDLLLSRAQLLATTQDLHEPLRNDLSPRNGVHSK